MSVTDTPTEPFDTGLLVPFVFASPRDDDDEE